VMTAIELIWTAFAQFLLLISIVMLVLLSSCSVIDEDFSGCHSDGRQTPDGAIAFSVTDGDSTVRGTSRTPVGTVTLDGSGSTQSLRATGFGVFACHTGNHPYASSTVTSNFMWNQQVSYESGNKVWGYSPVKYWPSDEGGNVEYVTFFAYAPFSSADGSNNASSCITDFSTTTEEGDPWLIYQLGGTETDWKSKQVDLLYAFSKDKHNDTETATVGLNFHHALACAGDQIEIALSDELQSRLKAEAGAVGGEVTLTMTSMELDYTLLRKGRLVLNGNDQPNWQTVSSENPMVHRQLTIDGPMTLASATSSSVTADNPIMSTSGNGVFYIPLNLAGNTQTLNVNVAYRVTTGATSLYSGSMTRDIPLTIAGMNSKSRNMNVLFSGEIPGVTLTKGGSALYSSMEINVGDPAATVTASVHPSELVLNWTNSNDAVATIASADGGGTRGEAFTARSIKVTPVAVGTTTVTAVATDGSVMATFDVTVK